MNDTSGSTTTASATLAPRCACLLISPASDEQAWIEPIAGDEAVLRRLPGTQFERGVRAATEARPPRLQVGGHLQHAAFAIDEKDVDGVWHEQGVHAAAGGEQQRLALVQRGVRQQAE